MRKEYGHRFAREVGAVYLRYILLTEDRVREWNSRETGLAVINDHWSRELHEKSRLDHHMPVKNRILTTTGTWETPIMRG